MLGKAAVAIDQVGQHWECKDTNSRQQVLVLSVTIQAVPVSGKLLSGKIQAVLLPSTKVACSPPDHVITCKRLGQYSLLQQPF